MMSHMPSEKVPTVVRGNTAVAVAVAVAVVAD